MSDIEHWNNEDEDKQEVIESDFEFEFDKMPEQLPTPQQIQAEFEKLVQEKFGDKIKVISQQITPFPLRQSVKKDEIKNSKALDLVFDYKPKDIKNFLDSYVIKQDEAKKALAIAVCDHYNHVHRCQKMSKEDLQESDDNYSKQNVLMLGPTGVGKTYLVKTIAKLIGVPFVKADATRFTETGYVGANVDDMVRDLVSRADGNIELAQYGIVYLDEVDKLAGSSDSNGKDISGRGVQVGLLKLMEETEIDLRSGNDMISQMQSFMDMQMKGKVDSKVINTKHILFIVSGAFTGLEEIIKRRLKTRTIGINPSGKNQNVTDDIFKETSTKDLIDFGLEPEFIGRLPVRLSCQQLSVDDLYQILKDSKGSIITQYIQAFDSYGIKIRFTPKALYSIAQRAFEEKTGARALMTVCERIFRDFKFELPSTEIKELLVTKKLVEDPARELARIMLGRD